MILKKIGIENPVIQIENADAFLKKQAGNTKVHNQKIFKHKKVFFL